MNSNSNIIKKGNINAFSEKLNWIGSSRRTKSLQDVTIREVTNNGRIMFSINVRNGVFKLFTETPYFMIALYKNRIYFKQAEGKDGILLGESNSNPDTKYARVYGDSYEFLRSFLGDYELNYDEFYDLYYVERRN